MVEICSLKEQHRFPVPAWWGRILLPGHELGSDACWVTWHDGSKGMNVPGSPGLCRAVPNAGTVLDH